MIVLTILKIIGLVLLALLALLLTALLLVLFVPIRYRADGTYREKIEAKIRITWLLHLCSAKAEFDGTFQYCVRVAGIRLLPKKEKPKVQKENRSFGKKAGTESGMDSGAEPVEAKSGNDAAKISGQRTEEKEQKTAAETAGTDKVADQTTGTAEKSHRFLAGFFERISGRIRKFREKCRAIFQKIRKIRDNISYYIKILEREETKQALSNTFEQLKGIIRHVLPKKLDICFWIGIGDPASTGQLMALQGMFYPILQNRVRIVPDFEEKRIEGSFHIKGRIRIAVLLVCGLRVFINRNFRQLIKLLRKKEEA